MNFIAHDVQSGKAHVLEVPIRQAERFLSECDNQFDQLAERLKLINGHLILREQERKTDRQVIKNEDFEDRADFLSQRDLQKQKQQQQQYQQQQQQIHQQEDQQNQQKLSNSQQSQPSQLTQQQKSEKISQENLNESGYSEDFQEDQEQNYQNESYEQSMDAQEEDHKTEKKETLKQENQIESVKQQNIVSNSNAQLKKEQSEGYSEDFSQDFEASQQKQQESLNVQPAQSSNVQNINQIEESEKLDNNKQTENKPQSEEEQYTEENVSANGDAKETGETQKKLFIKDDDDESINIIRLCKLNNIQYTLNKDQNFGIQIQDFQLDQCEAALLYLCQVLNVKENFYPQNFLYRAEIDQFFSWIQFIKIDLNNQEKLQNHLKALDQQLKKNNLYITCQQEISVADLYAFYIIEKIGNIQSYKNIVLWFSKMKKELLQLII